MAKICTPTNPCKPDIFMEGYLGIGMFAGGVLPTNFTGLQLWAPGDGKDTSITVDGSNRINPWIDNSTNNNNLIQAVDGNKPVSNGQEGDSFEATFTQASSQHMDMTSNIALAGPFTVMQQLSVVSTSNTNNRFLGHDTDNSKTGIVTSGKYFVRIVASGSIDQTVNVPGTSLHWFTLIRDSSDNCYAKVDTAARAAIFGGTPEAGTWNINLLACDNIGRYLDGAMKTAAIIYDEERTDQDIDALIGSL